MAARTALLKKFPDFDPMWTDNMKNQWFCDWVRLLGAITSAKGES